VVAAAGCGGGSKTYSEAKSRSCVKDAGLKVTNPAASNVVASAAEGGAFVVRFPSNLVVVSFGLDRDGAERIVRGFQRFHGQNIGLTDVLHAKHNAVLLWAAHPQDEYLKVIEGCLHS
jgi:myo-inositol-hexaphosphate 3-phosphohydrolase